MREKMVRSQIEVRGVRNSKVLSAMRKVPRHLFVEDELRDSAYNDYPLPIGEGQTISQPYIVALMTELLEPEENFRVLEVGTGSGYQAAVLAEIVKEVYTIEIIPSLSDKAGKILKKLGYTNISINTGDGYLGWPEHAPFDGIIITCAPKNIPEPLIEQLKDGGRMVIPVGDFYQKLQVLEKRDGKISIMDNIAVRFVPMTGIAEGEISLPEPSYKGAVSVEEAIRKRKSVRLYGKDPVSVFEVSQMLWAAGGKNIHAVTGASRTAPSAGGKYPYSIYLIAGNVSGIPAGIYRYLWKEHNLKLMKAGDFRDNLARLCYGQNMIKTASAFILFSVIGKQAGIRYGEKGERYAAMDIGHSGENLYLQAVSLKLGTCAVGAFNDGGMAEFIGVEDEMPVYLFPFGRVSE
ncbi:MAG: protein-L-isoaspartate(D-aspartate) O-methyltransferase [Planctomycetota bacterium]